MLGTVVAIDPRAHRMVIETGTGERRELDLAYVARHVEHAYALTGHSAQGSTVSWAGVIGRPQEFSREWAYTALSRARKHTTVHLIAAPSADAADRASYAPQQPEATTADVLATLACAMATAGIPASARSVYPHAYGGTMILTDFACTWSAGVDENDRHRPALPRTCTRSSRSSTTPGRRGPHWTTWSPGPPTILAVTGTTRPGSRSRSATTTPKPRSSTDNDPAVSPAGPSTITGSP